MPEIVEVYPTFSMACASLYAIKAKAGAYILLEMLLSDEEGERQRAFVVESGPYREVLSPMKLSMRWGEVVTERLLDEEAKATLHQVWFDSLVCFPTNLELREVLEPSFFEKLSTPYQPDEWEEAEVFPTLRKAGATHLRGVWTGPNERTIMFNRRLARHVTDSVMEATEVPFNYTYKVEL